MRLPNLSNYACLPSRAGGSPFFTSVLSANFEITSASSGSEGIEKAKESVPDIIVSDVMMPEVDGLSLLKTLKSDELTSHIPIVLLTAKGNLESKIRGLSLHADDYISKPFNEKELYLRLRNLLDAREIIKQKFSSEITRNSEPAPKHIQKSEFLERIDSIITENYADATFSVNELSNKAFIGDRQLLRKLNAVTGLGVKEYIRTFRLKKAAALLKEGKSPSMVAAQTGFSSQAYFSVCFKAHYSTTPSDYANKNTDKISG